ncbi:MAG: iron-sulfur cluster assembly accessory protein [Lysobacteraceae bacterium]
MNITMTPAALERARSYLAANPGRAGLHFGVRRTGCSGWGYVIELAEQADADDAVFDVDGVKVIVDAASLPMVQGTRIDFVKQGLNAQFVFENPNAADACGCGESFTTQTT